MDTTIILSIYAPIQNLLLLWNLKDDEILFFKCPFSNSKFPRIQFNSILYYSSYEEKN